jgi:hypothetical protein
VIWSRRVEKRSGRVSKPVGDSELLKQLADDLRREALMYDSRCPVSNNEAECNGCRARMLRDIADRLYATSHTLNTYSQVKFLNLN